MDIMYVSHQTSRADKQLVNQNSHHVLTLTADGKLLFAPISTDIKVRLSL